MNTRSPHTDAGALLKLADANQQDAEEFCRGAFGPFVLDVSQYVTIVAELMQHATDRALQAASQGSAGGATWAAMSANVKERLGEGDGVWMTCTGCHNTEDGHDVGHYPHSEVFGCKLGGGCGECGGIGAIWDTTDYGAMAEEMLAEEFPPVKTGGEAETTDPHYDSRNPNHGRTGGLVDSAQSMCECGRASCSYDVETECCGPDRSLTVAQASPDPFVEAAIAEDAKWPDPILGAQAVQVPCPVCGSEAIHALDVLKRTIIREPEAWDAPHNRSYEPVETLAKVIYDSFVYDGPAGTTKPAWTPGGNGTKQDEARDQARGHLRQAGHSPSVPSADRECK